MPANPTTKKGRQTRTTILDAAGRVFARDGYVEARMIDIATEAGLSTGGLYRYFDNKTEVLAALVADMHEEFYEHSGHTRPTLRSDPLAGLTEANRGYIEYYYKNRHVMRVFVEAAAIDERFRVILRSMRDRHVKRFAAAYRAVANVDQVGGVSIEVAAEAMACMVEQCCYIWFAQESDCQSPTSMADAIAITSHAWYATMFADAGRN
ncbi:MAG: TetR/AcrR family transcriptional regulator [Actinomycetes bacterium]